MSNKKDLSNYYLDLDKVSKITNEEDRSRIHDYYKDMLSYTDTGTFNNMATSIFNTLDMAGYIKDRLKENRDEKIGELING